MRRMPALAAVAALLGGCAAGIRGPWLEVGTDSKGWQTEPGLEWQSDATYHGRLADLVVSSRAYDPYTPVRLRVRPSDAASVTLSREGGSTGVVGAWRLRDRNEDVVGRTEPKQYYIGTRVPRALGFGESVAVPAGADLVVEFDPGAVTPETSLSRGDPIEFDVRVQVGDDVEFVPVRLDVRDTYHGFQVGWYFR